MPHEYTVVPSNDQTESFAPVPDESGYLPKNWGDMTIMGHDAQGRRTFSSDVTADRKPAYPATKRSL